MRKTIIFCVALLLIVMALTTFVGCCAPFSCRKSQEIVIDNGENEVIIEGKNGSDIKVKIR